MVKRSANWNSAEEVVLVEEIGKREGILLVFGKMKGDGCVKIGKIRNRRWQEIANVTVVSYSLKYSFLYKFYIETKNIIIIKIELEFVTVCFTRLGNPVHVP